MYYQQTEVWKRAMQVAREVYRVVAFMPAEERFAARPQITRAAVSIVCNIAEGWTRESSREKAQFLAIAQGSAAELDTLLILGAEVGWMPPDEVATVRRLLDEVSRMLTTMRRNRRDTKTPPRHSGSHDT